MELNCSVKSLFFDRNLILRTERTLQQKQTLDIMDQLKKELDAAQQVTAFLALQWRELKTSENLAEMTGLGKETGTDVAIVQIASMFLDLKKENEKLKEHNDRLLRVRRREGSVIRPKVGKNWISK